MTALRITWNTHFSAMPAILSFIERLSPSISEIDPMISVSFVKRLHCPFLGGPLSLNALYALRSCQPAKTKSRDTSVK